MDMGRKLTVLWNARELSNSVLLFTFFCCRAVLPNVPYRLNAQFGYLVSTVKQFCENTNSFMVIQPKPGKLRYFFPFQFVYIPLVGSVTVANGKIEWCRSISVEYKMVHDFNQAVLRTEIEKNPCFDLVQFSAMFYNRFQMLYRVKKFGLSL